MPYRFPPAPAGRTAVLVVSAQPEQERSWTSEAIDVPAGARLRFALGVDEPVTAAAVPVRFAVTVVAGDRQHWRSKRACLPCPNRRGASGPSTRPRSTAGPERASDCVSTRRPRRSTRSRFPVWGDPRIVAPARAAPARRNLLLVSLDTLRADALGCYGAARPTSPTIDARVAAEGTLFTAAFAPYPQTAGSHMTLLTSLEPCVHDVVGPLSAPLRPDAHTLAEQLRAHGYATAAFTEDGWITAATGFGRGFGVFVEDTSAAIAIGQAEETFERGRAWIDAHRDVPWFVFLHTYQVHDPFTPPPGYRERVAPDADDALARYHGEVRYTDELFGRLLAALDAMHVTDDTVVVVTSDHGEHFGEHGLTGHDNSLYDELLRVPLLVRAPGLVPAGRRIDTPVGLVDLAPTVLDLLGVPPMRWAQGRSFAGALAGRARGDDALFAWWRTSVAVRDAQGARKWLFAEAPGVRAFDLRSDPGEQHDLGGVAASVERELRESVARRCAAPPRPDQARGEPELDPRVTEKLKALGYLDDD